MKNKPCPFCGAEIIIYKEMCNFRTGYGYKPKCTNLDCIFSTGGSIYNSTEEAMIRANDRKPIDKMIRELKKEKKHVEKLKIDKVLKIGLISGLNRATEIMKGGDSDEKGKD